MAHSPNDSAPSMSFRQQVGGALLFLGGTWGFLVFRDYYNSVLSVDATPSFLDPDYRYRATISAIVAVVMAIAGLLIFLTGRRSVSKRHTHHHSRGAATAPILKNDVPSDEPESPDGKTAPVEQRDNSPDPQRSNRAKVRRRVRIRVRKEEE